jgi:hypothetical protein
MTLAHNEVEAMNLTHGEIEEMAVDYLRLKRAIENASDSLFRLSKSKELDLMARADVRSVALTLREAIL